MKWLLLLLFTVTASAQTAALPPATSAGSAIHHAIFGVKLKEKADAAGTPCILRLQDQPDATATPEDFLVEQLTKP